MADILNETMPVVGVGDLSDSERYDSDTDRPELTSSSEKKSSTEFNSSTSTSSSSNYSSYANSSPVSHQAVVTIPNTFNKEVMEKLESLYNSPYQNEPTNNNQRALNGNKSSTLKPSKTKPEPTPRLRFAPPPPPPPTHNTAMLDSISESISSESNSTELTNKNGRFLHNSGFSQRRINSEICLTKFGNDRTTNSAPADMNQNCAKLADTTSNATTTKSKSISNLCTILAPIPENSINQYDESSSTSTGTRCNSQIGSFAPNSTSITTASCSSGSTVSHHQSSLELFRKNPNRTNISSNSHRFAFNSGPSLVGKQIGCNPGRSTLPGHTAGHHNYSFGGSLCHLSGISSSVNSTLTQEEMLRVRYLTYGTSAQLRQEYDKFLPWPSLTEFRLRRKFRRFKRRARKLLGTSSLLSRIQTVRRLVKIRSRSSTSTSSSSLRNQTQLSSQTSQTLPASAPTPAPSPLDQNVSRSSSLTSLLNLIEEANKNLINSFNNTTPKLSGRPQCPPRLKRAMSSVNISSAKALSKGGTLQRNSTGVERTCLPGPKILTTNKDLNNNQNIDKLWNSRMLPDSYQIAFIDQMMQKPYKNNVQKKTATLKPSGTGAVATTTTTTTTADQNDSDTISVKSLESYFGSGVPMPVSGPSPKTGKSASGQNSKVLRVRSHFQINNGTVYLEDSDWEMCSEIDSGGFADDGGPESMKSNSVDESGSNHNLDTGAIGLVASPRQLLEVQPVKPGTPVETKIESASVSTNDSSIEGAQVDKVDKIEQVEIKSNKVLDDEEDEDEKDDIEDSKLSTIKHGSSNQIKQQFREMAAQAKENNNNNNVNNNKPVIKPKPKILVPIVTHSKPVSVVCPSHNSKLKGPAARPKVTAAAVVRRPIKKMAPKAPLSKQNLDNQDGATGNKSKQSLYHKNCCKSKHAQAQQPSSQAAPVAATSASLSKQQSSNNQSKDNIGAHKKIDTSNSNSQSNNCSHSCASRNIDNDKVSNQKISNVPKSSINNNKSAKPAKLPQVKTKISKISMMKTNLLSKTSSSTTNKPRQQQQKQQSSSTKQKNKTTEDKKSTKSTSVATASKSSSSSHGQMALIDRIANRFMMNKNKSNATVHNNSNDNSETGVDQSKQASLPCIDEHLNDDADTSNKEDCPIIPIINDSRSNFVPVTESDNLQLPPITTGAIAVEETTKACHLDKNSDLESSSESSTKVEITATDSSNLTNVQMEENLTKSQTNVLELIDKFNNLSKQSPCSENDNLNPIVSNQDGLFRSILTNNNNNQSSQNSQPNLNLEGQFEQYFHQFYQSSQLPSVSTSNSPASSTNTNSDKNNRDDINSFCSRLIQDLESKFNQRLVITKPMSETVSEPTAVPSRFAITNHNGINFQNDANLLLLFFLYNQRQMLQEILHQMLTSSAQNRNQPEQESNKNVANSSKNVSSGITIASSSVDSDTNSGTKQSKSEAQLSEFNRLIQLLQTSLKQQQQINENIKVLDSPKTNDPKLIAKEQEQNSQENIPKTADPTNNTETNADFNNNSKNKEFNANVNCSGSNRFVNKIVLNNSINQYNFNMNSADSPPPLAAAPSIVNVINDNSVNCAANLFDVNISGQSTTTNDDSQYCSDSDYTDYGVVSVNVPESSSGNSLRPVTNPGGSASGQHRTVLEIKNPSNKFGGLFSTLRYQLEKKRNKNRMERLKKKDLAKADSLTTALENSNRNGGGQGSGVTVANTSTLEIKGIVAECQSAEQRQQTSSKENSKVGGTLRRLLSPSRDGARSAIGGTFGGSTTSFSNSSSSKLKSSGSIMEISNPNPIGLESMFGTIRRQDQRNPSKPKFPINQAFGNQRSRSEMNFRSIIKLNDQEEPPEEEEEEGDYDDCQSASLYDSIGNQSDCSTIYDRIDGRRMERQRNEPTPHRFRSHLEIRPQPRVPNHPNLLSHRTSSNCRTIYYGSQINLSGSKDHHSAAGQRYRAKPVVTFTLPRSFKSNKQSSSSSSNRPNMANLAGRFEHHQRRFIMDHQEEEEKDEDDQFDGHQRGHYEDDCDGQHGPGCDTPTQQSCSESSDSSDPESDRTIMSSDRNRVRRQPQQQQQQQQQPRRRQQLYLPPKSPDESIDDECEYFLTPCKLNERYFRSRNRYR